METQSLQLKKANKIKVPFYSPPSTVYGQTSAEIIKEARAVVMNTSAIGIKPVFTSRPFTPKENERTLFGNAKKRNSRPPSSFSLSYLQKQEVVPRVKLPSIGVPQPKKQHRPSTFRNVVSLDNLTEEYEAEILEEKRDISTENLPAFRKSYSCPQERVMTRAVSYTERMPYYETDKPAKWVKSTHDENALPVYSVNHYQMQCHYERCNTPFIDGREESNPTNVHMENAYETRQKEIKMPSYDRPKTYDQTYVKKKASHVLNELQPINSSEIDIDRKPKMSKKDRPASKKKKAEENISEKPEELISRDDEVMKEVPPVAEEEAEVATIEMVTPEEEKPLVAQPNVSSAEKSVSTEPQSEYLASLLQGPRKAQPVKIDVPVKPKEILELYETARYYGVVLDETKNIVSTSDPVPKQAQEVKSKSTDDIFGEKENVKGTNHLDTLKINFKEVDEKMKRLNESIEKFETKLKNNNHTVRMISDNAINEAKVTGAKKPMTSREIVMNSNKRYHVSSKNAESGGEKAYKKWSSKQEVTNQPDDKAVTGEGGWDFFWKNTYFRTKGDDVPDQNPKTAEVGLEYYQGMVDRLNGLIKMGCDSQEIIETTKQLYEGLKNGFLNNSSCENKFKERLLRTLYQFADNEDPEVLLSLARIIFFVRVESSLPAAFKMVFKVARSDANDHLFIDLEDILELFLEGIGRASPLESAESCVYGYGALKFLTMNHAILSRALHLGALDLMTLHMKMINNASMESNEVGEQTQHALFQLTGALRHVAAGEGALPLFITTNCIPIICKTLSLFRRDEDLVTNISRTLSLLSTDEDIVQMLVSVDNILSIMVDLMDQYKNNDKILIRISYCLGNIVAHSDLARIQISRNEGSVTTLLNVLKLYIDKDLEISMKEKTDENAEQLDHEVIDDVIVKIIRILANMSMNPVVGSNLSPATNEKNSIMLTRLLSTLLLRKDPGITLLATLGCLNNISYYCNTHSTLVDITQGVERVLGLSSEDCQAEAARVLGNLTRHKEIRDLLYSTGGVNQLSKLLSSKDREVVRCACGALVNMMLDLETRKQFVQSQGIDKLIQALEYFAEDWSLAGLVCRAIWNSCAEDVSSAMLHNDMEHLLNTLANALEEENWNDGDAVWEEFATIATDLLERINTHLESA